VYCVHRLTDTAICSGGEDGIVNIWDVRGSKVEKSLEHCTGKVGTPENPLGPPGKHTPWISCISVDPSSQFMVCGGGARILSLWDLAADKVLATMPTAGNPQSVVFHQDSLVSAGNDRYVYQWEKGGKILNRVRMNTASIFTISQTTLGGAPLLAAAGTGPAIDLFTEPFGMKASLRCS